MVATDVASRGIGMIKAICTLPFLSSSLDVLMCRLGAVLSALLLHYDILTWSRLFVSSTGFHSRKNFGSFAV